MNNNVGRVIRDPALRRWAYGVAAAGAAVLVGYGIVTTEQGGLWLALVSALLGAPSVLAAVNTPPKDAETDEPAEDYADDELGSGGEGGGSHSVSR